MGFYWGVTSGGGGLRRFPLVFANAWVHRIVTAHRAMGVKDRPIVVACLSGHRSVPMAQWLMGQGYAEVYNLKGGFLAWKGAGQGETPGDPCCLRPGEGEEMGRILFSWESLRSVLQRTCWFEGLPMVRLQRFHSAAFFSLPCKGCGLCNPLLK